MSSALLSAVSNVSQASTSSSVYSLNTPPLPLLPSPSTLLPHLDLAPHDLLPLLRHALLTGAQAADVGLIRWLLSLTGDVGHLLPGDIVGEDGESLVSLAIMGSAAREEKEECVRLLVRRIGVEGCDSAGWTPLHLAALHSTPPLISFLLTSGADPHAMSLKGFTPLDMISDLPSHSSQTALLTSAMIAIPPLLSSSSSSSASSSPHLPATPASRRHQQLPEVSASVARAQLALRNEKKEQMRWEKENWVKEVAVTAQVDVERLLSRQWEDDGVDKEDARLMRKKRAARKGRVSIGGTLRAKAGAAADSSESGSEVDDGDREDEDDEEEFYHPDAPTPYHTLLVFSLPNLPSLLDTLISSYPPNAHPRSWRSAPANAIYLFARFALYRCDEDWLEELIVGVVDRIEKGVYDNVEDLAHLAFWNYNTTLLLHLLQSDEELEIACHEMSLLVMLEELINAIHVFVIRVVEKRIDSVLDAALLDYESMSEEFGDVTFEGEWNFLKSLTGRGATAKKAASRIVPKAKDIFPSTSSPRASMDLDSFAREGFGSLRERGGGTRSSMDFGNNSSTGSNGRPMSMADFRSPVAWSQQGTPSTPLFNSTASSNGHPIGVDISASSNSSSTPVTPRTITSFLTSVLVVLQLYEVNPAITCQAFSQVYYWVGCETFNRILTRKRYLCRSKAVQIRMNMTSLEDWVRDSGLPVKIATKHLEPVNQLLQWLQTCSSLNDFDNLIVMVQSLRSLNPLQMRRATKDYRFEVNEGKMSDECAQYLAQLQKDWEKRRVRIGVEALQREISEKERARLEKYGSSRINPATGSPSLPSHSHAPSEDRPYNPALLEPATVIDALFDPSTPLGEYNPPTSPECLGELLDSRFMLPFSLPSDIDLLVATPPEGAAFALLHQADLLNTSHRSNNPHSSPSLINAPPRPSSRTSFSSLKPLRYAQRPRNSLKELPEQFLGWLDEQEQSKIHRESRHLGSRLSAAVEGTRSSPMGLGMEHSPGRSPTGGYSSSPSSSKQQEDSQSRQQSTTLHIPVSHSWPSTSRDRDLTPTTPGLGQTESSFFSSAPSPGLVDDFGNYSNHSKEDSERTVSSHGRDGSSKTIRRPERLQTIMPNFPDGHERAEGGGGREEERDLPESPSSAKSWLKKIPGRKGSILGGRSKS